jgi:hypothetical protein
VNAWFDRVDGWSPVVLGGVEVVSWQGGFRHDGRGTAFVVALESATIRVEHGVYPLCGAGWAVLPVSAKIEGGSGLAVTDRSHRGLFVVGGPVESSGRLTYIDGCSDTVLVSPVIRGDPCVNLLHLPARVVQSDHDHPAVRVGVILRGVGRCVTGDGNVAALSSGVIFVLEAGTTHRFETGSAPMSIIAWHPDSDYGPTDDDHPMLNRTLRPGTNQRVR